MDASAVDVGLLFLRLGFGGMIFFAHAIPKLLQFSDRAKDFVDPVGVGSRATLSIVIGTELICSAAVVAGFETRIAAIPLILISVIVEFILPSNKPHRVRGTLLYPKETARLYFLAFVAILLAGGGGYSVDAYLTGSMPAFWAPTPVHC